MPKQIPFYGTRDGNAGTKVARARPSELSLIGVDGGGGVSGVATQASGIPLTDGVREVRFLTGRRSGRTPAMKRPSLLLCARMK